MSKEENRGQDGVGVRGTIILIQAKFNLDGVVGEAPTANRFEE